MAEPSRLLPSRAAKIRRNFPAAGMIFFSESMQAKQDPLIPRYHLRFSRSHDTMIKWINREHVKVDRVACPWLHYPDIHHQHKH